MVIKVYLVGLNDRFYAGKTLTVESSSNLSRLFQKNLTQVSHLDWTFEISKMPTLLSRTPIKELVTENLASGSVFQTMMELHVNAPFAWTDAVMMVSVSLKSSWQLKLTMFIPLSLRYWEASWMLLLRSWKSGPVDCSLCAYYFSLCQHLCDFVFKLERSNCIQSIKS